MFPMLKLGAAKESFTVYSASKRYADTSGKRLHKYGKIHHAING